MNDECIGDTHPDNEWRHQDDDSGLRYADVVPEREGVMESVSGTRLHSWSWLCAAVLCSAAVSAKWSALVQTLPGLCRQGKLPALTQLCYKM